MFYDKNMFQITNNNVIPQKGNILISEPFLWDKYFERSVVFLVEHDDETGTMGFILNKMMKEKVIDFFPDMKGSENIPVFKGGPVGSDKLYFIHTLGDIIPDTQKIIDDIYFGGDFDVIKSYIESGNPITGKIKFFLGYSGWEQKQLSDEISNNSWVVGNSDLSRVMKSEGEILWKKSLQDLGEKYRSWINFPKRPFMN